MMKKTSTLFALLLFVMTGCVRQISKIKYPQSATVAAEEIHIEGDSTTIYLGGYGSSIVYNPTDSCFYLLTDRGPNVDGLKPESKVFPLPNYAPTIGRFRLVDDSLVLVEKIKLKEREGKDFTGLPNTHGDGVTGEVALDLMGHVIVNSSRGLDSEGLAIAPDGTFWVSDEYAPFVMQFNRTGVMMRELSPSNGLPAYLAKRRPNRGMEGLTISKDGTKLYGIMQSPLYLPNKSTKDVSVNNRIIEIDLRSGTTREFIYTMENAKNLVNEICFVNDSVMLALERDEEFPTDGTGFKRVYKINMSHATDISGREIELLSTTQLKAQHINPVTKELFVDIIKAVPGYRHDKAEGIALIGDSVLCVANDNDFGINSTSNGKYAPKLDRKGRLDKNMVYFIRVKF